VMFFTFFLFFVNNAPQVNGVGELVALV